MTSPDTSRSRLASDFENLKVAGPKVPAVSTATGWKMCVVARSQNFFLFLSSARIATALAFVETLVMDEWTREQKVSLHVASQTSSSHIPKESW